MGAFLMFIAIASYFVSFAIWMTAPSISQQLFAGLVGVAATVAFSGAAIVDKLDQLRKLNSPSKKTKTASASDPSQNEPDVRDWKT